MRLITSAIIASAFAIIASAIIVSIMWGTIAYAYINGPAPTAAPCAELTRYIGSEGAGMRLTSISHCRVNGRTVSAYVTGVLR